MKEFNKNKCKGLDANTLIVKHIENNNEADFIMYLLEVVREDMLNSYAEIYQRLSQVNSNMEATS